MDKLLQNHRLKIVLSSMAGIFILFGILFRFYHITGNDFFLYDEGYYLNYNRGVMYLIAHHAPQGFADFFRAFAAYLRASLAGAKALWFLVINARVYIAGFDAWYFPRVVSAVSGSLALGVLYLLARDFFRNRFAALLSVVILALLPSHVFYSRLALQESLSTLLVLLGFYYYLKTRRFGLATFVSAVFLAAAFFTNYRLIVLPALVGFSEFWLSLSDGQRPDIRKLVWHTVTFFSCVFLIGGLDGGKNTYITFGWMFHQANLAKKQFAWINFFSFPYYLFRLDNVILGGLFFGNVYFLFRKEWRVCFPFVLVCLYMVMFSFASEKGARYLCVMTPFIAMAVAWLIYGLMARQPYNRSVWAGCALVMLCFMYLKSWAITKSLSDYRPAADYILSRQADARFVSTQNYVQNLYVADPERVQPCPSTFEGLFALSQQGYRYLVLCPQAYVSLADKAERFNPRLSGFLEFVRGQVNPVQTFPHLSPVLLERFVFDHNENLLRSIRFLSRAPAEGYGEIRVYDLPATVNQALAILRRVSAGK